MKPSLRRLLRLAGALGVLAVVAWWVDPRPVAQALSRADWRWVMVGLLCSTAANAASAWRWRALAAWLGQPVPLTWALPVYFRGVAANAVLPGAVVGGDVWRAWSLHRRGMPVAEAGASVLLDRIGGLWVLLTLGVAALAWRGGPGALWPSVLGDPPSWLYAIGPVWLWGLAAVLLAIPYAVLRWPASTWGRRWPVWRWWRHLAHQEPARQYGRQLLGSLAVQLLSVTTLYLSLLAVGVTLPWTAVAIAAVPIFVLATLPLSFGGWGTREAAAVAVLLPLGVDGAQAMAASVLYGLYPVVQSALALWPLRNTPPLPPSGQQP